MGIRWAADGCLGEASHEHWDSWGLRCPRGESEGEGEGECDGDSDGDGESVGDGGGDVRANEGDGEGLRSLSGIPPLSGCCGSCCSCMSCMRSMKACSRGMPGGGVKPTCCKQQETAFMQKKSHWL